MIGTHSCEMCHVHLLVQIQFILDHVPPDVLVLVCFVSNEPDRPAFDTGIVACNKETGLVTRKLLHALGYRSGTRSPYYLHRARVAHPKEVVYDGINDHVHQGMSGGNRHEPLARSTQPLYQKKGVVLWLDGSAIKRVGSVVNVREYPAVFVKDQGSPDVGLDGATKLVTLLYLLE
jgi:hypothetical protein